MTFEEACKIAKEHGMKKNFNCDNISVLEFENEWWFSYIPEGGKQTSCPQVSINKDRGELKNIFLPVPPLENLKIYNKGKKVDFYNCI